MLANVGTQAAFNTNAWEFLTAGTPLNPNTKWTAQGSTTMSLRELIEWPASATGGTHAGKSQGEIIMANLQDNAFNAIVSAIVIPMGFKVGRKVLRKPIRMGNKLLKTAGLRSMVKI